jgi:biopolymer transport protein ExbD
MKPIAAEESSDLPDLTPMIDIVFLLIVFFMTVAKMEVESLVEIDMPIAANAVVPEERGLRMTVTLTADGRIYDGPEAVALDDLADRVAARKAESPALRVHLRADAGATFRQVREVFAAAAEGGVPNIVFATYQSDK